MSLSGNNRLNFFFWEYMQELFCWSILRICQYRIKIFMEVGINYEMYDVSKLYYAQ